MLTTLRKIGLTSLLMLPVLAFATPEADAFQRGRDRDDGRDRFSGRDDDRGRDRGDRFDRRDWRRGNYWGNYWRWYDRDYRPYWHRRGHRDRFDRDDFGFRYSPYPYRYGYRYYDPYNRYYYRGHSLRGPHNSLQLGPLHFDWR